MDGQLYTEDRSLESTLSKVISLPDDVAGALGEDRPVGRPVLALTGLLIALFYALLWSTHWYPLSDSSLYLHIARGLAQGNDLEWVRSVHRSIRPMTPWMLSWVIRAGGDIGAMHVVVICLTLMSQLLSYLTLKRWFNQRLAFWLTVLTSASWWVYANAFTIMTEPLFLNFFWGCLLALSLVKDAKTRGRQWALVVLAAVLLAGAWYNRVAAMFLAPGMIGGLWMSCRRIVPVWHRLAWALLFVGVVALLWWDYRRPVGTGTVVVAGDDWMVVPAAKNPSLVDADEGSALKGESGYRWRAMVGITNPVFQYPTCGGRWSLETLAAPFVVLFKTKSKPVSAVGIVVGTTAMLIMLIGWVRLAMAGQWWPVALGTYFIPLWLMWGTRVKPRYMIPIAPVLFVMLVVGATWLVSRLLAREVEDRAASSRRIARRVLGAMLLISLVGNGAAYAVEVYIRHGTKDDFYDVARRGAMAELVDICSYLRKNAPADARVTLNRGASRRIIGVMSQRPVFTVRREQKVIDRHDTTGLEKLFERARGPYVIVLYDEGGWPQFHWPIAKPYPADAPARWWQLFERQADGTTFKPVAVPRDRSVMGALLRKE